MERNIICLLIIAAVATGCEKVNSNCKKCEVLDSINSTSTHKKVFCSDEERANYRDAQGNDLIIKCE